MKNYEIAGKKKVISEDTAHIVCGTTTGRERREGRTMYVEEGGVKMIFFLLPRGS